MIICKSVMKYRKRLHQTLLVPGWTLLDVMSHYPKRDTTKWTTKLASLKVKHFKLVDDFQNILKTKKKNIAVHFIMQKALKLMTSFNQYCQVYQLRRAQGPNDCSLKASFWGELTEKFCKKEIVLFVALRAGVAKLRPGGRMGPLGFVIRLHRPILLSCFSSFSYNTLLQ